MSSNANTANNSFSLSTSNKSTNEQLIHRLVAKISSLNNLNDKAKDEFVKRNYAYAIRLFSSDSFAPIYDSFEVSEKIKKKCKKITFCCWLLLVLIILFFSVISQRKINDVHIFNELEAKFSKTVSIFFFNILLRVFDFLVHISLIEKIF